MNIEINVESSGPDYHDAALIALQQIAHLLAGGHYEPRSDRDAALCDALGRVITARRKEPEPKCLSNCRTCGYAHLQEFTDGGHCYMFQHEPVGVCAKWLGV
jgi:hypothetical protein